MGCGRTPLRSRRRGDPALAEIHPVAGQWHAGRGIRQRRSVSSNPRLRPRPLRGGQLRLRRALRQPAGDAPPSFRWFTNSSPGRPAVASTGTSMPRGARRSCWIRGRPAASARDLFETQRQARERLVRTDRSVDRFQLGRGSARRKDCRATISPCQWKATLLPPIDGEYLLEAEVDDSITVRIDGKHGPGTNASARNPAGGRCGLRRASRSRSKPLMRRKADWPMRACSGRRPAESATSFLRPHGSRQATRNTVDLRSHRSVRPHPQGDRLARPPRPRTAHRRARRAGTLSGEAARRAARVDRSRHRSRCRWWCAATSPRAASIR